MGTKHLGVGLVPILLLAVGCGGSSSGGGTVGDVDGLSVGTQLNVVGATAEAGESDIGDFPPDSDYNTDRVFTYVWDPSMQGLDTANMILCMMDQTAYDEMVNEGNYIAQVDMALCEAGEQQDGGSGERGQSQSSNAPESEYWTVRSSRAHNNANQQVRVWVPNEDDRGDAGGGGGPPEEETIYVRINVSEGADEQNPFGVFHMDFAGAASYAEIGDPNFRGTLETLDAGEGNVGFGFYENSGDVTVAPEVGEHAHLTAVNVQMSDDQSTGFARIREQFRANFGSGEENHEEEFLIAFNDTHFKRTVGEDTVTLSRTDFNSRVWRYNLYHADGDDAGQQVDIQSGFPVRNEDGLHGWADFWGVWFPEDVDLQDGDVLTREFRGGDAEEETYTIAQAPGKLFRFTRQQLTKDDIVGEEFTLFWFSRDHIEPPQDFRVRYLNSDAWELFQVRDFETGGWTDITPENVDLEEHPFLDLWSDGLGGHAVYVAGDLFITFWTETMVSGNPDIFGGGDELELFGFVDCLKAGLTADEVEVGDVFLGIPESVESPHEFVFRASDNTLYLDDGEALDAVGLADGEEPDGGPFDWGMRSGPMVEDTTGIEEVFDIWMAEEFYVYETGDNPWNQFIALLDEDDATVQFSPPIEFTYTHTEEGDRDGDNTYEGKTYLLHYGGPGQLWGIPHESFGNEEEDGFQRWYPQFSLADGTLMGPNGTEYVVKAIDIEQKLAEDPGGAPELDVSQAESLVLPDGSTYVKPDNGEKPDLDEPPAVIFGEVQDTTEEVGGSL